MWAKHGCSMVIFRLLSPSSHICLMTSTLQSKQKRKASRRRRRQNNIELATEARLARSRSQSFFGERRERMVKLLGQQGFRYSFPKIYDLLPQAKKPSFALPVTHWFFWRWLVRQVPHHRSGGSNGPGANFIGMKSKFFCTNGGSNRARMWQHLRFVETH